MQTRIYAVTSKTDGKSRLVEAATPAQAMRHVAHDLFDVQPANARKVAELMTSGVTLETSKSGE
jgi:hypothetical protein